MPYYPEHDGYAGLIFQLVSLYTREEYEHACAVADEAMLYSSVLIGHTLKVAKLSLMICAMFLL